MSEENTGSPDSGSEVESEALDSEIAPEVTPTPAEIKKYKKLQLKFNGKEIEEDLDFEVDDKQRDWMIKQRQKAMLADHKAQEFSQLEREVGAFIQELRKNPKKALSNPAIGLDIKELAASILQDEIDRSQKSPEQLRAEEAEARLQELMDEREKEKQDFSQKELERLTEREFERYDTLMSSALEASDLPKSPYVVKKMTEYMIQAVENNLDLTPQQILPLVREEMVQDIQQMFEVMPAEVIESIIGKQNLDKLRKSRVAAVKPPVPVKSGIRDVAAKKTEVKKDTKQQTIKDFFGV